MLYPTSRNLLTTEDKIQDAAVLTYTKRLANRPIKDDLQHIKDAKEALCDKLLEVARSNKTPPWEMKHLEKGDDLKLALLKFMNRIKQDQVFPECLELCNISSIWKRKGPRNDFESYRGIFRVTIF